MKRMQYVWKLYIQQILRDPMLITIIILPIICCVISKSCMPFIAEQFLKFFNLHFNIVYYYPMIDLLFGFLAAMLLCFVSSLVVLTEIDDKVAFYFPVTPIGKSGYFITRIVLPECISWIVTFICIKFLSLVEYSILEGLIISLLLSVNGLIIALIIIAFSKNKVEGMAIAKLAGMVAIGVPIPFFINSNYQIIFGIFPSFWIGRYVLDHSILNILLGVFISIVWLHFLFIKASKRI